MNVNEKIAEIINSMVTELTLDEINQIIEIPPNKEMGDFAIPCFRLAKVLKKSPNIIASELALKLEGNEVFEKVNVIGGYVNIFVNKGYLVSNIFDSFCKKKEQYGSTDDGKGKTVCLDYSSPNIAKQFHIGHLRTTVIGNALAKIHSSLGYKSVRINHLGDWGTQFGKLIVAYKKWGSKETIEDKGIDGLMELYVKFHDEAEKDDSLNDEARKWFTEMEKGNEEALELWNWFKDISMIEFNRVYDLLDVEFDSFAGESFYIDKTEAVIKELEDKGLLVNSEGAKIVDLSDENMPPVLIMKKDGSTIYATRDLAAAIYRKNTYDFDKCLYVTGLEQKLHFSQCFKVIGKMGYEWEDKLHHVPYGLVSLKSGKLSTRKGQIILLEELLKEAIRRSEEIINEKNPDLENKDQVAKDIGIGAIIFNDLYNNRIKDVIFSWDKVLNFDGETGPYVQYTHARACSLLKKGDYKGFNEKIDLNQLTDDYSVEVLKQIEQFPDKVREAAKKLEPSIITRYVVDVAQAFNKFYSENPILIAEDETKEARLTLTYMAKTVLSNGLNLLGIKSPDRKSVV